MKISFFYITTKDKIEACKIGRALVEARLAAGVNIIDAMHSIYHWEGSIHESSEAVLIVKTRQSLSDTVIKRVRELHSYMCPCIVEIPISNGDFRYLQWIGEETDTPFLPDSA